VRFANASWGSRPDMAQIKRFGEGLDHAAPERDAGCQPRGHRGADILIQRDVRPRQLNS
jgi:hypothetical protein